MLAFKALSNSGVQAEVYAKYNEISEANYLDNSYVYTTTNGLEIEIKEPVSEDIVAAKVKYQEKLERVEAEKKAQEELVRQQKLTKTFPLQNYLTRMKSPMADYSELIYDSCMKYGEDYCKYFLAIAAVESGYGIIPIGCCQAWGMIYVKYPSWEVAIPKASEYIAQNYYLKYPTLEQLALNSKYHGGDQEAKIVWLGHLNMYYNQIPL